MNNPESQYPSPPIEAAEVNEVITDFSQFSQQAIWDSLSNAQRSPTDTDILNRYSFEAIVRDEE